jgi:hypothetical protein
MYKLNPSNEINASRIPTGSSMNPRGKQIIVANIALPIGNVAWLECDMR